MFTSNVGRTNLHGRLLFMHKILYIIMEYYIIFIIYVILYFQSSRGNTYSWFNHSRKLSGSTFKVLYQIFPTYQASLPERDCNSLADQCIFMHSYSFFLAFFFFPLDAVESYTFHPLTTFLISVWLCRFGSLAPKLWQGVSASNGAIYPVTLKDTESKQIYREVGRSSRAATLCC